MYQFWVFVHLIGVFGFLLAHGVSAAVGMSLRRERDPQGVRALLELFSWTLGAFYVSFLVLWLEGSSRASWATGGDRAGSGPRSGCSSS
ncbi:MAG TPA: hypothetical protein VGL18_16745 [Actinomycetota bacterium]|jgi:hypothetical protein